MRSTGVSKTLGMLLLVVLLPLLVAGIAVAGDFSRIVAFGDSLSDPGNAFLLLREPICEEPDEFLFWDGIHPTRAAHGILARRAHAVVSQP